MADKTEIAKSFKDHTLKTGEEFNFKAIFFDMDGVLYDSMPMHSKAWFQVFRENGLDVDEIEPYLNEGATAVYTVRKLFRKYLNKDVSDEVCEKIKNRKHYIMGSMPEAGIMCCMKDLLDLVKKEGIDCWVVTGSAQSNLLDRLEHEFEGCIMRDKMITAHDVRHGKPNPEPYLKALKKSGYKASESIVIENAPLGVESAKAAGLFTIAINTGPLDPSVLKEAGADIVLSGSRELYELWPEIYEVLRNS